MTDSPSVLARVVRHLEAGRRLPWETLELVGDDGALPLRLALSCGEFQPGDEVEIRLVKRLGPVGEKARVLAPDGRPLAEPVPYDFRAEVRLPVETDPFEVP